MLHAVYVRKLKEGVTYEEFRDAWLPDRSAGPLPARISVSRSVNDAREVLTIVELDVPLAEFTEMATRLNRPDALLRIDALVESTRLQNVYEQVYGPESF